MALPTSRISDRPSTLGLLLLSLPLAALDAQVGPAVAPSQPEAEREVVELPVFTVDASQDNGYVATNTLAGSRINMALKDTPSPISVFTKDFLEDIGANDVAAAVQYSLNFEADNSNRTGNLDQERDINVKARNLVTGPSNRRVSRNYFVWFINGDVFNTEQISFSRGPNAILFGLGEAGGTINTTTKMAYTEREIFTTTFKTDNEGTTRISTDINQPITDKFALRFNALWQEGDSWQDWEYKDQLRFALAATLKLFKNTTVRYDGEWGDVQQSIAQRHAGWDRYSRWTTNGQLPYDRFTMSTAPAGVVRNSTARPYLVWTQDGVISNWQGMGSSDRPQIGEVQVSDFSVIDRDANLAGPGASTDNSLYSHTVFLEQRLRNLNLELGYNVQNEKRLWERPLVWDHIALKMDPNVKLPDGVTPNPNYGEFFTEQQYQVNDAERDVSTLRLSAAYLLDLDRLGQHNFVAMLSRESLENRNDNYREVNLTPFTTGPGNNRLLTDTANVIYRRTYLTEGRTSHISPRDIPIAPVAFNDPVNNVSGTITPGMIWGSGRITTEDLDSALVAMQSSFLDRRLFITAGWREDRLDQAISSEIRDTATNVVTGVQFTAAPERFPGTTRSLGAVFNLTKAVSVYANTSNNFNPQTSQSYYDEDIGNVKGEGWDVGLKFSFFDNKVYATVGYYETDSANLRQNASNNYRTWMNDMWEVIEGVDGPNRIDEFADTKDTAGSGAEFELVANLTKSLRLMANYATGDSEVSNKWPRTQAYIAANRDQWLAVGDQFIRNSASIRVSDRLASVEELLRVDLLEEGQRTVAEVKNKVNFFGNYTFEGGFLKGFDVGLGFQWRDRALLGFNNAREEILGVDYTLVNLALGYRMKLFDDKVGLRLRLNVDNLLDEDKLVWEGAHPDGTLRYYRFIDPRKFSLTATFTF